MESSMPLCAKKTIVPLIENTFSWLSREFEFLLRVKTLGGDGEVRHSSFFSGDTHSMQADETTGLK